MQSETANEPHIFLSTGVAGRRDVTYAGAAVFVSAALFLAAVPFASRPLAHVPAFIPAYESALILSDLITAVLLFGQFSILQSRSLFVLACGYLFTAFIAVAHELSFPGVFSPTGLLGAGPQTTVWLYSFWHGVFPISVILYALLKDNKYDVAFARAGELPQRGGVLIAAGVAAVLALACALTFVASAFEPSLPVLVRNNNAFAASFTIAISCFAVLCIVGLVLLWRSGPHSVLDLWLMVVMCAWLFDITLCGVFNTGRYDLGWYAGRVYGLLAASSLLAALLIETASHYVQLALLSTDLSNANRSLERMCREDGLTRLANRRRFDTYLAGQIAAANRHKRVLALVMCDVDCFKGFNDHYGHQEGDECLKQVAAALQSCCRRPTDLAARYGGEEFAIILPDTELIGAIQIAEAAREAVAQLRIAHAHSPAAAHVTISCGVALMSRSVEASAASLILEADQMLFQAKRHGRDCVIAAAAEQDANMLEFPNRIALRSRTAPGR